VRKRKNTNKAYSSLSSRKRPSAIKTWLRL
jgi:hypothetical protein